MDVKVLVLGSGGREHALCWKIAASPRCGGLFAAPGNPGTATVATNLPLNPEKSPDVLAAIHDHGIDLVVVGPEAPLVAGVADDLRAAGVTVFGPGQDAARLESSKAFTRALCDEAGIPGARWCLAADADAARTVHAEWGAPIVVKADGLAGGKGVTVAETEAEALAAIEAIDGSMVLEERLEGVEASLFVLCTETDAMPLAMAQDYKPINDGDQGANTGGMGSFSPIGDDDRLTAEAMETIINPTLDVMRRRGTPFQGLLYAGLINTVHGLKLIEYNVRFGDPECQSVLMRLEGDLLTVLHQAARGTLDSDLRLSPDSVVSVVLAARGYPGSYAKGELLPEVPPPDTDTMIFQAGTVRDDTGQLRTNGGRVLNVCARGQNRATARQRAYAAIDRYRWTQGFWRRDIGAGR